MGFESFVIASGNLVLDVTNETKLKKNSPIKLYSMEKVELLNNIQKMVVDIHIKMYDLRNRIAYETDLDVKQRAEKLLRELDEMQTNLHEQFNILDSSNHDRRKSTEIEEKIFDNFKSFDAAFETAGNIFRSRGK
jgi:uncharacterized 2Fe-2S/4Fe-4S cluster protein (DUF4445 family)